MTPKIFETEQRENAMADRMDADKASEEWVLDSINDYYMRMDG